MLQVWICYRLGQKPLHSQKDSMAIRKPKDDAARALQGSAVVQYDFIATYRPDLLVGLATENSRGLIIGQRALRGAVMQTYAFLLSEYPKQMGRQVK